MLVARLIRSAALACSGAVVALAQLHLPDERFWQRLEWLQWMAVVSAASLVLYEAGETTVGLARLNRLHKHQRNLHATLSAAVAGIVKEFGVSWDEVAVCYYHRRRPWPFLRLRLEMVAGVRAGAPVVDLPAAHRAGCGVAGTAFTTRRLVSEQWRTFAQDAITAGPQAWEGRPPEKRYGLNWGQLNASARPDYILANPTFDDSGAATGCFVVYGPLKESQVADPRMTLVLESLTSMLYVIGPPPRGWWRSDAW